MKRNWVWIILIFLFLAGGAFFYLQYWTPVQEAKTHPPSPMEKLIAVAEAEGFRPAPELYDPAEDVIQKVSLADIPEARTVLLLTAVIEVDSLAFETNLYLDSLTADLEGIGQIDPVTGDIRNKKEREKNYRYWLGDEPEANGGRGNGAALKLRKVLNDFARFIHAWESQLALIEDKKPALIAPDPKSDSLVPVNSPNKELSWEQFTFKHFPLVADLAMMEKYKVDVAELRQNFFDRILHSLKNPTPAKDEAELQEAIEEMEEATDSLIYYMEQLNEVLADSLQE